VSTQTTEANNKFELDVTKIRNDARKHMDAGAVTAGNAIDIERLIGVLNEVIATEIVCYLRYKRHYFMARGIIAEAAAAEFLQHATDEQGHADQIAMRIIQLQGEPNFSPDGITSRSHAEYVEGDSLTDMIREDLVAERVAIESYSEIIRWLGDNDPTTRNLMETILAVEEEHANDMLSLLEDLGQKS
jgi:bacterioferritin